MSEGFWETRMAPYALLAGCCLALLLILIKALRDRRKTLAKEQIICPNLRCGYGGKPHRQLTGGQVVEGILLLFVGVLPGVLFLAFRTGKRWLCPRCGLAIRP